MGAHLFFPFTPPDLGLPPAPAAFLLPLSPLSPFPPFSPPPFFAPSFAPSGDAAFDRRPLRVCRPWDRVDGIVVVLLWLVWWGWLCLWWVCCANRSSSLLRKKSVVGTFGASHFLFG